MYFAGPADVCTFFIFDKIPQKHLLKDDLWKPAVCILPAKIRGLISEPTKLHLNQYRRVGAFNMDPTGRCEFAKFDPHNFERQMVTII